MTAGAIPVPTVVPLRVPDPGQSKFAIDTNTRIELRSSLPSSENVALYYTTNGTRPDPFNSSNTVAKSTLQYQGPFTLPSGKITIKVLAVLPSGKESAINTKTLSVSYVDAEDFLDMTARTDDTTKSFGNTTGSPKKFSFPREGSWMKSGPPQSNRTNDSASFSHSRTISPKRVTMQKADLDYEMNSLGMNTSRSFPNFRGDVNLPKSTAGAFRISRDTDFLRCIACFAQRPADPNAKFCHECGYPCTPMTEKRLPPPEPGSMGTCIKCNSLVPLNTDKCVVCESDLADQFQPQATLRTSEKKRCDECHALNPPSVAFCLQCETRLTSQNIVSVKGSVDLPPRPAGVPSEAVPGMVTCSKCSRVNNPDARFCDWCGTKPQTPKTHAACLKCTAANHPYARFCAACGALMEAPDRQDPRNTGMLLSGMPVKDAIKSMDSRASATWLPVSSPSAASIKPKTSVQTQTAGLFYPSTKAMEKYIAEDESKKVFKEEKKIPLSAISPGKGYWRQNVDFITNHLKAHSQNDPDFRKMVGSPKLGKLMSATIHEDGHEFSLVLNFPIRSGKDASDPFKGKNMLLSKNNILNSLPTRGRLMPDSDHESDTEPSDSGETMVSSIASDEKAVMGKAALKERAAAKKKKKKTTTKKVADNSNLSTVNRLLFSEIGSKGEGNIETIKELLSEDGANAESVNSDGERLLVVAVRNKRVEAITALVEKGADVNKKAGSHGNTALHEAVLQAGGGDQKVIETLLQAGATPTRKNDKGQTPYDIAVDKGYESTVTALASTMGQDMLNKLSKPVPISNSGGDF